MLPVVSIVGRPNVGKSTLFNRMMGERKAIVHDSSGVTRDRHYGEAYWNGVDFTIIDTGGYLTDESDAIVNGIRQQVKLAIEESDVILFVVDVTLGITDLDLEVAQMLRQQKRPVLVISNKSDNEHRIWEAPVFYGLGFDEVFAISSISGLGTGDLLDRVIDLFPEKKKEQEGENIPKLAFVGRPNVGKSSIVNSLLNHERSIVTDIAGTTRDSINSPLFYNDKEYILVDTAGLRKRTKVNEDIEFYSTIRTHKAIREADIVIVLVDALQGMESQEVKILQEAEQFNKGIIIAVNKWDLIEKETNTLKDFEEKIRQKLPTMTYVPIISVSALTKQRLGKLMELVDDVIAERRKKISTSELNSFIERTTSMVKPPSVRGTVLSIKYGTMVKTNPPVFSFFMNRPSDLPANYRRFIESRIREEYQFTGVPITMVFKAK
jgi:GTP-binding protein